MLTSIPHPRLVTPRLRIRDVTDNLGPDEEQLLVLRSMDQAFCQLDGKLDLPDVVSAHVSGAFPLAVQVKKVVQESLMQDKRNDGRYGTSHTKRRDAAQR